MNIDLQSSYSNSENEHFLLATQVVDLLSRRFTADEFQKIVSDGLQEGGDLFKKGYCLEGADCCADLNLPADKKSCAEKTTPAECNKGGTPIPPFGTVPRCIPKALVGEDTKEEVTADKSETAAVELKEETSPIKSKDRRDIDALEQEIAAIKSKSSQEGTSQNDKDRYTKEIDEKTKKLNELTQKAASSEKKSTKEMIDDDKTEDIDKFVGNNIIRFKHLKQPTVSCGEIQKMKYSENIKDNAAAKTAGIKPGQTRTPYDWASHCNSSPKCKVSTAMPGLIGGPGNPAPDTPKKCVDIKKPSEKCVQWSHWREYDKKDRPGEDVCPLARLNQNDADKRYGIWCSDSPGPGVLAIKPGHGYEGIVPNKLRVGMTTGCKAASPKQKCFELEKEYKDLRWQHKNDWETACKAPNTGCNVAEVKPEKVDKEGNIIHEATKACIPDNYEKKGGIGGLGGPAAKKLGNQLQDMGKDAFNFASKMGKGIMKDAPGMFDKLGKMAGDFGKKMDTMASSQESSGSGRRGRGDDDDDSRRETEEEKKLRLADKHPDEYKESLKSKFNMKLTSGADFQKEEPEVVKYNITTAMDIIIEFIEKLKPKDQIFMADKLRELVGNAEDLSNQEMMKAYTIIEKLEQTDTVDDYEKAMGKKFDTGEEKDNDIKGILNKIGDTMEPESDTTPDGAIVDKLENAMFTKLKEFLGPSKTSDEVVLEQDVDDLEEDIGKMKEEDKTQLKEIEYLKNKLQEALREQEQPQEQAQPTVGQEVPGEIQREEGEKTEDVFDFGKRSTYEIEADKLLLKLKTLYNIELPGGQKIGIKNRFRAAKNDEEFSAIKKAVSSELANSFRNEFQRYKQQIASLSAKNSGKSTYTNIINEYASKLSIDNIRKKINEKKLEKFRRIKDEEERRIPYETKRDLRLQIINELRNYYNTTKLELENKDVSEEDFERRVSQISQQR
jgi:hypothetical protein